MTESVQPHQPAYNGILFSLEKEGYSEACQTQLDLEDILLSEKSHTANGYVQNNICIKFRHIQAFLGGSDGEEYACNYNAGDSGLRSLGREDPLEKERTTYSSILVWDRGA